jgi:ribose 5-phosphate isomerase B
MIIAIGSDHAGFEGDIPYKPAIMKHVEELGHKTLDCGTNGNDSVDYPDYANAVCDALLNKRAQLGILMCGTGIGIGIAANRHKGIRAAVCATPDMARLSREHNDANILCLGRRVLALEQCFELIDLWLHTPFNGGERHCRRIQKMG